MQKTAPKNTYYSKNESILKIAKNWPRGKGYRLCKIATLAQELKMAKTCEKRFCNHIRVVVCKKRLQKTPNIRKMRAF